MLTLPDRQITGSCVQLVSKKYPACVQSQITSMALPTCSAGGAHARSPRTLEQECDGRLDVVRRTASERTEKSCGSDASTPASSPRRRVPSLADDSDKKARSLGRARRKP